MWAVAAAGPAVGQAVGRVGGAQDSSAARQNVSGAGQSPASSASIVGVVIDSLNGGPLVGAQILAEGMVSQAFTDSTGRFRIDSVPPGHYRVGIFHPLLDSLGLSLASPPLTVTAGGTLSVVFATPSAPTFVRLMCGDGPVDTMAGIGPSVLIGRVLNADTDEPTAGVRVSLTWIDVQASQSIGLRRIQRARDTTSGPNGEFRFCHLPSHFAGVARATGVTGDSSVVSRPYAMNGRMVSLLVLHVPGIDTALSQGMHRPAADSSPASRAGGAALTGRVVRSDSGAPPFVGAQVMVSGTKATAVTGDSGQFALQGLPAGTRTLQVRALGWEPVSMSVELTRREARHVTVQLAIKTAVLKTIVVTAALNAGLHRVGYDTRKQMGIGHFLGADDIAKRNAFDVIDLMAGMPGVTRRVGRDGQDYLAGTRGGGGCVGYVVDGVPYREMTPGDINTYVRPEEIGAIEVYQSSESPAAYAYTAGIPAAATLSGSPMMARGNMGTMGAGGMRSGGTGCVKILIWTKTRLGL